MLHWLAGQKQPEVPSDPDATGFVDAPETPAPVFAVRAFKHAIFGTPQTVQPKPRRHSNTEATRPRHHETRTTRPVMMRPKSASDAQGLGRDNEGAEITEPVASPTKGILMTPGTAGARRKTVTFGAHVQDNEEKKSTKSGLPDDCPGKFPSPWTKSGAGEATDDTATDDRKGKTKLTEALEQVREESAKKSRAKKQTIEAVGSSPNDFADPQSECGRYWKTQYDVYRENTQREVRKLITKQKSAKSYAKDRDTRCTELADELKEEKRSVERLERRIADLETQLKQLQQRLDTNEAEVQRVDTVTIRSQQEPKRESDATKPAESRPTAGAAITMTQSLETATSVDTKAEVTRTSTYGCATTIAATETVKEPRPETRTKSRPKIEDVRIKDLSSQSKIPSSTSTYKSMDHRPISPRGSRTVTSGTNLTPLKSLSINTLPTSKIVRRDSAQPSPPADRPSQISVGRHDSAMSPKVDVAGEDDARFFPTLPLPSPESKTTAFKLTRQSPTHHIDGDVTGEVSMPLPVSGLCLPAAVSAPQPSATNTEKSGLTSTDTVSRKENISPEPKGTVKAPEPRVRPSAAWNAINAPGAGKRVTSLVDKSGKEFGLDRLEAAKARLAAKGKAVS